MITALDIVTFSLREAGITASDQPVSAADINDGLTRLNMMVSQWQRKRWLIWHLVDYAKVSTGAQSYTVGVGGDFSVPYIPEKLESAFLRQTITSQPNQVDYPLKIIASKEAYQRIGLKQLQSFERYIFYDYTYELGFGTAYPWPVPNASIYELHLTFKAQLAQFAALSSSFVFPPEYQAALHYNLARRHRAAYRLPPDDEINSLAKDALNTIRMANTQIPTLQMPEGLARKGLYDIYSDQLY
jgi:hypothetical protein